MSVQEKITTICSILKANNRGFLWTMRFTKLRELEGLFQVGFENDDCQDFAEQLVNKIYTLSVCGLNKGFDSTITDAINECIDLAIDIKAKKLSRQKTKLREIENRVEKIDIGESKIKIVVLKYIDTSIEFARLCIAANPSSVGINNSFNECIAVLTKIKEIVEAAIDENTKSAATYAKEINDQIRKWRQEVQNGFCGFNTVTILQEAVAKANKWQRSLVFKGVARESDIDHYDYDMVANTVEIAHFERVIKGWEEILQSERNRVDENAQAIEALESRISEYKQSQEEVKKRIIEKKKELANGRITKAEYKEVAIDEANELMKIDKEIQEKQSDISRKRALFSGLKERLTLLEKLIQYYYDYKDIAHLLWASIKKIDINKIILVVRGLADVETSKYVTDYLTRFFSILDMYAQEARQSSSQAMETIQERLGALADSQLVQASAADEHMIDYEEIFKQHGIPDDVSVDEVPEEILQDEVIGKKKHSISTFNDDDIGNR